MEAVIPQMMGLGVRRGHVTCGLFLFFKRAPPPPYPVFLALYPDETGFAAAHMTNQKVGMLVQAPPLLDF